MGAGFSSHRPFKRRLIAGATLTLLAVAPAALAADRTAKAQGDLSGFRLAQNFPGGGAVPGGRDIPGLDRVPDVPGYPGYPNIPGRRDVPNTRPIPGLPGTTDDNINRDRTLTPQDYEEQQRRYDEERDRNDAIQRDLSGEKPVPSLTPKPPAAPRPAAPPQTPPVAATPTPAPQQPTTQPAPPAPPVTTTTVEPPPTATAPEPTPAAPEPQTVAVAPPVTPGTPASPGSNLLWLVLVGLGGLILGGVAVSRLGPLSTREKPGTGNPNAVPDDGHEDPNAPGPTYSDQREIDARKAMVAAANAKADETPPPPKDPSDIPVAPPIYGHDELVGCCGPDVTKQLIGVLKTVIEDYEKLPWYQKAVAWGSIGFWDIEPLRDRIWQIIPTNCATKGSSCAATVMLFDRCFEAGVVNYTIYGVMEVLCGARWTGAVLHGAYWVVKEVTGKSSVRSLAAENFMISVGREFARGGGAAMKEQVQKVKGSPCGKCPMPAKPFHWNYTWWPLFVNEPSRH